MNREDIIRMADEAKNQWPIEPDFLERFAALVIANHPPQSYMTWQEGYEAGKQTEREACAKLCDEYDVAEDVNSCDTAEGIAIAIRARGQA